MATSRAYKQQIFRCFKINGLAIQSDAMKRLEEEVNREPSLTLEDVIYAIKNSIDRSKVQYNVVTAEVIESALDTLLQVTPENDFQQVQVFSSFELPKLRFVSMKSTYELIPAGGCNLHANVDHRIDLFLNRFTLIEQRVQRNKMFTPPVIPSKSKTGYIKLCNIESLLGTSGVKHIIGMLGKDERGKTFLEDRTGTISVDLSKAKYTKGLFTTNCIVLVQGMVTEDVLHAQVLAFPPPETRAESLIALGDVDPFGLEISKQQREQIQELEAEETNSAFILLSDVHLDDPQVLSKLDQLFQGYEPLVPPLFILMGNFTSRAVGEGADSYTMQDLKEYFDALADIISKYQQLALYSTFVFIPGPRDPGFPNVLPRPRLLSHLVEGLEEKLSKVVFATNPCRIRYYTQEIVVLRDDLQQKMRRHTVVPMVGDPDQDDGVILDTSEHLAKTIIDQGHLCPLPLFVQPIYWAHDSALTLFPLPNVLVLADKNQQYQYAYAETGVINPGPFHVDYSFVMYRPSGKTTEFSCVE